MSADDPIKTAYHAGTESGTIQVSFMKNPKRKRLAKACDACHKSKRRCDGTAPCSNCFFASKECTYTDAAGRPVPAPKAPEHEQQRFKDLQGPNQATPNQPTPNQATPNQATPNQATPNQATPNQASPNQATSNQATPNQATPNRTTPRQATPRQATPRQATPRQATPETLPTPTPTSSRVMDVANICQPNEVHPTRHRRSSSSANTAHSNKRHRSDSSGCEATSERRRHPSESNGRPAGLDPNLVRELVGLFFTHCHPFRMIINMPSFIAALSRNSLPSFLILAVCAVAAPFSKSSHVKTTPPRMAGTRFYQEAVDIMFDTAGRLVCEARLVTVQALCLLEGHEVDAQYSWAKNFRYIELASKIVQEMLDDQETDTHTSTTASALDFEVANDRECLRRCSWLIYFMDVVAVAYTRLPSRVPSHDTSIRLPVDETSFELGVQTAPEYLDKPAPRTNASEVGHIIRLITYFAKVEDCLALDDESKMYEGLSKLVKDLDNWSASLPDRFRFTEENLQLQQSMFETSANMGAWSFYYVHSMHACCMLSIAKANYGRSVQAHPAYTRAKSCITRIISSLGSRAINSNYLISCILWIMSRYCGEDHDMRALDAEYERIWGYKCLEIAPTWRKRNSSTRRPEERREKITIPNIHELCLRPLDLGKMLLRRERHYRESERRGHLEGWSERDRDTRRGWNDEPRRRGTVRESLPSLKAVGLL